MESDNNSINPMKFSESLNNTQSIKKNINNSYSISNDKWVLSKLVDMNIKNIENIQDFISNSSKQNISKEEILNSCLDVLNFDEIVPNIENEQEEDIENPSDRVWTVGRQLQKMTGASDVVLTQGKEGMAIFSKDEQVVQVPTFAKKVFDVTGAGDTVIAALALGVSSGLSLAKACVLANYAAGIVVAKVGCVPCEVQELKAEIGLI